MSERLKYTEEAVMEEPTSSPKRRKLTEDHVAATAPHAFQGTPLFYLATFRRLLSSFLRPAATSALGVALCGPLASPSLSWISSSHFGLQFLFYASTEPFSSHAGAIHDVQADFSTF